MSRTGVHGVSLKLGVTMPIYRRLWAIWAAAISLIVLPTGADAGVTMQSLGGGELRVVADAAGQTLTTSSHTKYKFCWKNPYQIQQICNVHSLESQSNTVQLGGFTVGNGYRLRAYCWCSANIGLSFSVYGWIELGELNFIYTLPPPPPPPSLLRSDLVRIRNLATGQCAYVDANNFEAKHWGCWPDPNMRFFRDVYSNGTSMFRDSVTGRCLWGGPRNVPVTGSIGCGAPGTHFQVQDAGGGAVRLFVPITGTSVLHLGTGGCLYAQGGNGGPMLKEACGSARTRFVLDPA